MSDGIVGILQFAIDGVTASQNAVANNIANDNTPGYTDTEVSFQSSLEHALDLPGTNNAQITTAASTAPKATDGNNVKLADELDEAEQDTLHYQTISESLNAQFRLIAGASGGSYS